MCKARSAGRESGWLGVCLLALLSCAGCRQDMHVQPRYDPYEPATFFGDGQSARLPVPGTVPRGELTLGPEELLYTGKIEGKSGEAFPFAVTREVVERGRERFDIFCAPCHGLGGDGDGMIVERGFRRPPSLHSERLRSVAPGFFFEVITSGFGAMYGYGYRIEPRDRWAVIAYIRALQLSRQTPVGDLTEAERARLAGGAR